MLVDPFLTFNKTSERVEINKLDNPNFENYKNIMSNVNFVGI